jgi:basic amino acid/polyamine antiporter, APA family
MQSDHVSGAAVARHPTSPPKLVRQIGLFDATMVVMGGIVGAGIFINPYVVAQRLHSPVLILAAWAIGGLLAILGAFIYAELADRMPSVGGQYAYLKEAYHPALGFLYGWVLLLVVQTGGMAAVTVTFAHYFVELTGAELDPRLIGSLALVILTLVNCLGVKLGSRVQSALTVLKIIAIACLIGAGIFLTREPHPLLHSVDQPLSGGLLSAFGTAMIPVLFAYGGWQTANFIAAEIDEPRRNLPRALVIGVAGVIALYVLVSFACLRSLGASGLASTTTPASAVMRLTVGNRGVKLIAAGIAVSTLGFLSQSILTAPRVYFAMAEDRLFFRAVGSVSPRTHVPVIAILLQSLWTAVIVFSGRYEQILNYVVSMDFLFFGLTATCLFVFRRRERLARGRALEPVQLAGYRVPGHPYTTLLFVATSWAVVLNTIYRFPSNSLLGMLILLLGLPVYGLWSRHRGMEIQK